MAKSFQSATEELLKNRASVIPLKPSTLNREKYLYFFFGNPVSGSNCLACWACSFVW